MSQSAKFWDRMAERYARKPVTDEAAYQKKLQVTQQYFQDHMDVLEIGCGTGSTALVHAPFVKHILATDVSPKMIEIARGKAAAGNISNVTFRCVEVNSLDIPDATVDVVLALNILHLLEDWERVISDVFRILKPGGVFVSSTACLNDIAGYLKFIVPIGRFVGLIPPVAFFSGKDLVGCLEGAGFNIDYEWQPNRKSSVFIVAKKP